MKIRMSAILAAACAVTALPAHAFTVQDVSCRQAISAIKQLHSPDALRTASIDDAETMRVLAQEGAYTAFFLSCSPTEQRMVAQQPYFDDQFIAHIPTDE